MFPKKIHSQSNLTLLPLFRAFSTTRIDYNRNSPDWKASYIFSSLFFRQYTPHHTVPLLPCTEETIQEYGRLVYDFDSEDVWITTWPQPGWRPICPGTGNQGGVTSGDFKYKWIGDQLAAINDAVGGDYITGEWKALSFVMGNLFFTILRILDSWGDQHIWKLHHPPIIKINEIIMLSWR